MMLASGNLISNFNWIERDWRPDHGRDFGFNEFLKLNEERREALLKELAPALSRGRLRARKADAAERLKSVVGCIVANAIVAMEKNPNGRVHYSRNERTYVGRTPYKPDWLHSVQMLQTIDALAASGLLKTTTGGRTSARGTIFRSTYRTTPALVKLVEGVGICAHDVVEDLDAAPVVLLRGEGGQLLPYSVGDRADDISNVRAFNALLHECDVDLSAPAENAPDRSNKRLRRIYNGSFDRGGRFYGGWWQGQPKDLRARITINGERTVERDFSGFLARAHYHAVGIDYRDDPYAVPKVRAAFEAAGISWNAARPVVKAIFFLMLNAKGRRGLHNTAAVKGLPPTISPKEAFDAIEEHHAPIHQSFYSNSSFNLMAREARICAQVLRAAVEARIPILPIHDSFVACQGNDGWLVGVMVRAYLDEFGLSPVVT